MQRNEQIDFFRGVLLILITVNHLISEDNLIIRISREAIGWVEGAAGFVFLSGFTVGLVYTYKYLKKGERSIRRTAFSRSWLIYKYHVAAFVISLLAVFNLESIRNYWGPYYTAMLEEPFGALGLALGLLYQPPSLDILPMYAVFLLLVPWLISYLHKYPKRHFVLLCMSFLVYLVGSFRLIQLNADGWSWSQWINTGNFDLLSWQFIFLLGIYLGYLSFNNQLAAVFDQPVVLVSALLLAGFLFSLRNLVSLQLIEFTSFDLTFWTDKKYLRPLRLVNTAAVFILIRSVMVKKKNWFQYKPVAYLGKNSIEVFSFHIILILLCSPFKPALNRLSSFHVVGKYYFYPLETLLTCMVVAALFLAPSLWNISSRYYQMVKLASLGEIKK